MDRQRKHTENRPEPVNGRDGVDSGIPILESIISAAYEFASKHNPDRHLVKPDRYNVRECKQADFDAILHASDGLTSHVSLREERQLYSLVTKHESFSLSVSSDHRKASALSKFAETQRRNRRTSRRLRHYLSRWSRMDPVVATVLGSAQLEIFRLLGAGPTDEDLSRFVQAKPFGPGVVQGLKSQSYASKSGRKYSAKDTNAYGKLGPDNTLTTSRSCLSTFGHALLNGAFGTYLLDTGMCLRGELKETSEGTVVPKDAVVDRFIAVEPMLNAMAQQGIAAMLRFYLERWHIYLENQLRNKELARRASILGFHSEGWATIDLSSASDTIVYELVRYLLPKRWFELLNAARTTQVLINGEVVPGYSSFCTMGNAFTFPLQCLIFGALTRSCMKITQCTAKEYRVYGDDIIAPIPASALLIQVLRFSGFVPNIEKTFITGFFRESCGGDFLDGNDVRPIYIRRSLSAATTRHSFFNLLQRSTPWHPCLRALLEAEKKPLVGPSISEGDAESRWYEAPKHLWSKFQVSSGRYKENNFQCAVYRVPGMVACPKKIIRTDLPRALLASLSGSPGEWHDLRGAVNYRVKEITVVGSRQLSWYSPYWF